MEFPTVSDKMIGVVNNYLEARARAEVLRERVDRIKRAAMMAHKLTDRDTLQPLTDPGDAWLAIDQEFNEYLKTVNVMARELGIKPDSMPDEYCPALVAEDEMRRAEHAIIYEASRSMAEEVPGMATVTANGLLCLGLDKYKQFIDLVVMRTLKAPNFK